MDTKIFQVISFVLLPAALLLGLTVILAIASAFGNIALLLPLAILAATVIYVFTSFYFALKGLIQNNELPASLKDWITVNAYVASAFSILCIMNILTLSLKPASIDEAVQKMLEAQHEKMPWNRTDLVSMVKTIMYVFFFFGSLLIVHIRIGFRLLKKNEHLFTK